MNYPLLIGKPGCAPPLTIGHIRYMRDEAESKGVERTVEGFFVIFYAGDVNLDVYTYALSVGVLVNPGWEAAEKFIPATVVACERAAEFGLADGWEYKNLLAEYINECEAHRWHRPS